MIFANQSIIYIYNNFDKYNRIINRVNIIINRTIKYKNAVTVRLYRISFWLMKLFWEKEERKKRRKKQYESESD